MTDPKAPKTYGEWIAELMRQGMSRERALEVAAIELGLSDGCLIELDKARGERFYLIDPPVGPFSLPGEIREWISTLRGMEQTNEVSDAIAQAEAWLKEQENSDERTNQRHS